MDIIAESKFPVHDVVGCLAAAEVGGRFAFLLLAFVTAAGLAAFARGRAASDTDGRAVGRPDVGEGGED